MCLKNFMVQSSMCNFVFLQLKSEPELQTPKCPFPKARRFSFIEGCLNSNIKLCWFCCFATGGRRPSTRSLPLQVDPGFAGSLLTEAHLSSLFGLFASLCFVFRFLTGDTIFHSGDLPGAVCRQIGGEPPTFMA